MRTPIRFSFFARVVMFARNLSARGGGVNHAARFALCVLLAAPRLAHAAAATPSPAPSIPPAPPAWEAPARALEMSRAHAEDALSRCATTGGGGAEATAALAAMLADADAYERALDAFTPILLDPAFPPAAADRHQAYLDAHRARHRALADALEELRAAKDGRAAAQKALDVLEETQVLAPRDAANAVAIRSVRRIPPRAATAEQKDLGDARVEGEDELPTDLAAPTPDLVAFARTLGDATPARITRAMRAEMQLAPFHAEALGASGCLRDRRCSAFDLATLLASLLRARGVPARLGYGVLELDGAAAAMRLTGGGDAQEALDALALGGVPAEPDPKDARRIRFEHVWVRARVDGAWVDLDPAFDPDATMPAPEAAPRRAAPEAEAPKLLARFLSDPADRTPFGADLLAAPPPSASAPAPRPRPAGYRIATRLAELSAVPPTYQAFVGLSVGGKSETPLMETRIPMRDAVATGILVYPRIPSALDRRIADALAPAGITALLAANRLPPHLLSATTVIAAGGRELAALPPAAVGTQVPITVTLYAPNGTPIDAFEWAQTGTPAAITVLPFPPGPGFLPARWHDADVHPEGPAGLARAFAGTGAQLFADLLDETERLAARAGGRRFVSESVAVVAGSFHAPRGLAKAPLFTDPAGITVDVGRFDEILLAHEGTRPVEFEVAAGAALSSWEARALRVSTGLSAVSTVVASKAGAAGGGAPRVLRGKAPRGALDALSPAGRAEVADALARDLVVVLPRVPQSLDHWLGESYVVLDPRSGRGAYLLRGTLHGAVTTDATAALLLAVRDGADPASTITAWRKGRAGRALLAREGWPLDAAAPATPIRGVDAFLGGIAARESVPVPSARPWPPLGGKNVAVELGTPISLQGVGAALWMGNRTRVLDEAVARSLGLAPPKGFDPKTRLWTGPTALAAVPVRGQVRLLPIPARY
ncbi:MAG TPA: transglutaminase domain-containing protein [bacterium]|nr:transglutaminase domain-containing protein [bacterium]